MHSVCLFVPIVTLPVVTREMFLWRALLFAMFTSSTLSIRSLCCCLFSKGPFSRIALLDDGGGQLRSKILQVKQLEANIGRTREAWEGPTEVEVELESRLSQLTDHLIQKQAQVEALSSEKATLLFRLEAISNALFEERSMAQSHTRKGNKTAVLLDSVSLEDDLEFGLSRPYDSRNKGINEEHDDFGGHPIVFILRQLDTIFSAGAYYLRRHGLAQLCALIYLVALHIWVMFVLFSHSQETEDVKPVLSIFHITHKQKIPIQVGPPSIDSINDTRKSLTAMCPFSVYDSFCKIEKVFLSVSCGKLSTDSISLGDAFQEI
eukprot:Gb_39874 [translate_table: standard]